MTSSVRGRRRGSPDTRAAILAAARARFAEAGFAGTTIRGVAGAAGVDPALVHHYFGSKDDLFVAALELPVDPRAVLADRVAGPLEGAGERLLRALLSVWDDPAVRPALLAMVRRLIEPGGDALFREGFLPVVLVPLGSALGVDAPERRMQLVASQVIGVIVLRYVVRAEVIVAMDADALVAAYAPVLDGFLAGPLR
ncbi:TetR family transcriptional regulator [Nocardioides carbamazepini]|uniref:TetR/AcrR family transcriptional regulator n=1 Tax=Nocardioides carbamazepini TaxID=2854259 RepID=UPI00214A6AD6|nr:TetR family transcriptional regulator [Nocardioides carbamazepini]MCR1783586.1 TetR family transcriptional regulator [Nocardioides carbamazepini]